MSILDGLNTQQEMALYLRLGRSALEMLEQGEPTKLALAAKAAQHKLELVETPPDIVPDGKSLAPKDGGA